MHWQDVNVPFERLLINVLVILRGLQEDTPLHGSGGCHTRMWQPHLLQPPYHLPGDKAKCRWGKEQSEGSQREINQDPLDCINTEAPTILHVCLIKFESGFLSFACTHIPMDRGENGTSVGTARHLKKWESREEMTGDGETQEERYLSRKDTLQGQVPEKYWQQLEFKYSLPSKVCKWDVKPLGPSKISEMSGFLANAFCESTWINQGSEAVFHSWVS